MKLPNDLETAEWFSQNIGMNNDCSVSSAIYKFRLWLKELAGAGEGDEDDAWDEVIHVFNITESPFLVEALKSKFNINRK